MKLFLCPSDSAEISLSLREVTDIETRCIRAEELYTGRIGGRVYDDVPYILRLHWDGMPQPLGVTLYINGLYVKTNPQWFADHALLTFPLCPNNEIFGNYYGYIRLGIELSWNGGEQTSKFMTDYLVVMISRIGNESYCMRQMAEYVYQKQTSFLWQNGTQPDACISSVPDQDTSLDALMAILQEIVRVYQHHLGFFRVNPHTRSEAAFHVDDFIKLQAVTPSTLQYIAQHPEELMPSDVRTGIRYQRHSYYPRHTLVADTRRVCDTYENRAVLGFLHSAALQAADFLERINRFLQFSQEDSGDTARYISSVTCILDTARGRLENRRQELFSLCDALSKCYWSYRQLFSIEASPLTTLPMATAVMMNAAPYRQIYDLMTQWFRLSGSRISGEDFLMPLLVNSQLYEYYGFFRLAEAIEASGYGLDKAQCRLFDYPVPLEKYRHTEHRNTFVFTRGDETITLYFQPVIWGHGYSPAVNNGIELRRTTTLSIDYFNNEKSYLKKVDFAFYTPDYILKHSCGSHDTYIIVDAKLSSQPTVERYQVQELAYKYQFSVQPATEHGVLRGVLVLYGKSFYIPAQVESVHDLYRTPHMPELWLMSLTEVSTRTHEEQLPALKEVIALLSE